MRLISLVWSNNETFLNPINCGLLCCENSVALSSTKLPGGPYVLVLLSTTRVTTFLAQHLARRQCW